MIKNISISYDAYKRLEKLKKEHESFTDVINRITRKANLNDFYGILSKECAIELEENIKKIWEEHKKSRINRLNKIII